MELKIDAKKIADEAMRGVEIKIGMTLKEAVDRQIAESPIYEKTENRSGNKLVRKETYSCPYCKKALFIQNHKEDFDENGVTVFLNRFPEGQRTRYCHNCGKRLMWAGD